MRRALVIGGSGPTGPHVLTGLLDRGYDVTMLHRGVHEPAGLPDVRHIHADEVGTECGEITVRALLRSGVHAEAVARVVVKPNTVRQTGSIEWPTNAVGA